jgi:hypothetical protein
LHALIWDSNPIFYIFLFFRNPEFHNFKFKLWIEQKNKIDILHPIVAIQLIGGWQHNYSAETRQVGHAKELSIYSLMSME